jgi:hypothetical protein
MDAGVLGRDGRSWRGPIAQQFGIRNREDFLNNPAAQDATLRAFLLNTQRQVAAYGLERYVGRDIDGIRGHILITYPGLIAAAHRVGAGAVSTYLRAIVNPSDRALRSRGVTFPDRRAADDALAAETRLRVFMNEPYSTDPR